MSAFSNTLGSPATLALSFALYAFLMFSEMFSISVKAFGLGVFLVHLVYVSLVSTAYKIIVPEKAVGVCLFFLVITICSVLTGYEHIFKIFRLILISLVFVFFMAISNVERQVFYKFVLFYSVFFCFLSLSGDINPNGFGYLVAITSILLFRNFWALLIVAFCLLSIGARGAFLFLLLSNLVVNLYAGKPFQSRVMLLGSLVFLLGAFFIQLYIAIYYYDDFFLNELLTKRPYIWGFYWEYMLFGGGWNLLGFGDMAHELAQDAGDFVALYSEHSRAYSPHSSFIMLIYEYGILPALVVVAFLIKLAWRTLDSRSFYVLVIYILMGFVMPVQLGGPRIYDFLLLFLVVEALSRINGRNRDPNGLSL